MAKEGKGATELQALLIAALHDVRACRNITGLVVAPIYPTDAASPGWAVKSIMFTGPNEMLPGAERALRGAVERLRLKYHLAIER